MKVYAFVGPSGTGKSYRAQMVAGEKGIKFIIDDGILVKEQAIIAGSSAKKADTKIETVKLALFSKPGQQEEIEEVLKKHKPESILILGTSDNMVQKIAANLKFPEISEYIYIDQVASKDEMETAKRTRMTEGKHVIPVPTFEIKKDFSGFLLDPLQIFKSKGRNEKPFISEKSIIRPTFSYLGNYTISDLAVRQIVEHVGAKVEGIHSILKVRVAKTDNGMTVTIEVSIVYGCNLIEVLKEIRAKVKKELENLTAMYIEAVEVLAKTVIMPEQHQGG